MHQWLGIAALGLTLTGCVSQEKYNALKLSRDQLAEQSAQADADSKTARAQADAYKSQLDQIAASGSTHDALLANANKQINDLSQQLAEFRTKYESELNRPPQVVYGAGTALPPQLSNTLSEFANANPDLVEFDAARGIVKFKSDVTFAPGSIEINARAAEVLGRFSQILNSSAAAGYDLMVAGHTDNTPIVRKATLAEGHFDNWYLSAHRAISVAAELVRNGVSKGRLGVAGYADQRPIASNSTTAGKAQNRRVEILILPTSGHSTVGSGEAMSAGHHIARASRLDKDSATADERPMLNK
jgi:chemotaxis protein MotB